VDHLSGLDTAFLCLEDAARPMQVGALLIFRPRTAVSMPRLASVLATRAGDVPGLGRSVRSVWWPPAGLVWADDQRFQAGDHIHIHGLDPPQRAEQLMMAVAEHMGHPLPPGQPPWYLHVYGPMADGDFAILPTVHHSLADATGVAALFARLLDNIPVRRMARTARTERVSVLGCCSACRLARHARSPAPSMR